MSSVPRAKRAKINLQYAIHKVVTFMRDQPEAWKLEEIYEHPNVGLDDYGSDALAELTRALTSNVKLHCDGLTCSYRPMYDVRNYAELLDLLKKFDAEGVGGIRHEELLESYPGVSTDIERLKDENRVFTVIRKSTKGPVYYYRDPSLSLALDQRLIGAWRENSVKSLDDTDLLRAVEKAGNKALKVEKMIQKAQS